MSHADFFIFLQVFWFFGVGLVMILYATTAGFDYGVTLLLPFTKKESERRLMLSTINATWDGNQTWLVFTGGALFMLYPSLYASVFSGLYAAMLCILWSLFLRPPGFDYREKIDHVIWRRIWDWALFLSALIPVFMFGAALGNALAGVGFYFDPIFLRPFYQGNFFHLLNLPGCLCGISALLMVLMHGSAWLHRRTDAKLKERFARYFKRFAFLLLAVFTLTGLLLAFSLKGYVLVYSPENATEHFLQNMVITKRGAWVSSYLEYPWKIFAPLTAYGSIMLAMVTLRVRGGLLSFWLSALGVAGVVATLGVTLFPFVLPSSLHPNESMTVWNSTSTFLRLQTMFYIALVCFSLIFVYKFFAYWAIWHKQPSLTLEEVEVGGDQQYR